jgi:hypothetical protein
MTKKDTTARVSSEEMFRDGSSSGMVAGEGSNKPGDRSSAKGPKAQSGN